MKNKKILVIIGLLLIVYFMFFRKSHIDKNEGVDVEEIQPQITQKLTPSSSSITQQMPASALTVISSTQQMQINSSQLVSSTLNQPELSEIEKATQKYAQIVPEYGDYAPTPKVLTGNSLKMFSYTFPDLVVSDFELKNIQSAFEKGIYPEKDIILILGLNDAFDGTIYIDYELKYHVTWSLQINPKTDPIQGIFSLTMNEVETSCDPKSFGLLKNVRILSKDDNGTILVKSCDQSFYMQLYRSGMNILSGIYFEKSEANGQYVNRGSVSLYRRSQK